MASSTVSPISSPGEGGLTAIPVRAVLPWALFFGILMLVVIYFVGAEQGATALISGEDVHEWVHDGRHLLGFPCH
ncbi:hypothetical protein KNE206_60900 [Kitasatospora sp. NE20-6]|uniref:CbtB domain-containing protein n=1 Tax=Kitasatospora sp. NE20-6 TaxID=2859066 RepID=UPI0034DC0689